MCERWMKIKNQTGFGEMTDPQFVQYLLRLEEERQKRMKHFVPEVTEVEPLYYEDARLSIAETFFTFAFLQTFTGHFLKIVLDDQ